MTDSDTPVMVCPINAIVVLVKSGFFVVLPMVFWLFRKMSGGFRYFTVHKYCSTSGQWSSGGALFQVITCFFSSRHIVNAANYSL